MANAALKVVDIRDHLRKNPSLQQSEIETRIAEQRAQIKIFDTEVMNLLLEKHKLKDAQGVKENSVHLEQNLVAISDWLESRIAEEKSAEIKTAYETQLKQCEQLIVRNERIKKNISDDLSACRYEEGRKAIDPTKAGSFIVGIPATLAGLLKIFGNPTNQQLEQVATVGVIAGTFMAFHHQAKDICVYMGKAITSGPHAVRAIKRETRNSAFNATIVVSLAIEEAKGLETNFPERRSVKSMMIVAGPR